MKKTLRTLIAVLLVAATVFSAFPAAFAYGGYAAGQFYYADCGTTKVYTIQFSAGKNLGGAEKNRDSMLDYGNDAFVYNSGSYYYIMTGKFRCKTAIHDSISNILSFINDKIEGTAMDQRTENEAEEKLEIIEDENPVPIEDLDLSIRAYNCLNRAGIHTIDQLNAMDKDDLMKVRNLNSRCREEILMKLQEYMEP